MKIFYVYYHSYDDMPMHVSDVIEELVEQKDNVHLFTSIRPSFLKDCTWRNRVQITNIPVFNIRFLNRLCYSFLLAMFLPFWCLKKRPDVIYERISFSTVLTVIIARFLAIPLISEVNGITAEELKWSSKSLWRIKVTKVCESFSLKHSSLVIAVTENIKEWLIRAYKIHPNKVEVVTNGTNIRRFYPRDVKEARTHFDLPTKDKFYVGYLGTLTPWCGVELLIECAVRVLEKFPQVDFIIGGGQEPYMSDFKFQVRQKGLQDHFRFYGNVPWARAGLFTNTFDIAIVSSVYHFSRGLSPLKLYSYLACNKPVIGSDRGEVGEVLRRYNVGLTFTSGDAESLGHKIIELLTNPKIRNEMGEKARQVVIENYSWTVKVSQLKRIIHRNISHNV
ncbi:MAG: glycosyltransferase family 4 protein [Deltaproteobacteria bacterium]|nr:MAG: glycosyltransferase family 4 protein [Deltaproteobacteria bacterium]